MGLAAEVVQGVWPGGKVKKLYTCNVPDHKSFGRQQRILKATLHRMALEKGLNPWVRVRACELIMAIISVPIPEASYLGKVDNKGAENVDQTLQEMLLASGTGNVPDNLDNLLVEIEKEFKADGGVVFLKDRHVADPVEANGN